MYDELIKDLREWPRICIEYTGSLDELHDKAADAIEELQADKTALNGTVTNLLEQIKDLGEPRWIPVTERLPDMHMVHSEYGCGDYMISDAVAIYAIDLGETPEVFCGMYEKDLGEDGFEGWIDCEGNHFNTVTHWMPLPEPPKEE